MQLWVFLEMQTSRFQHAQEPSEHLNLLQKDWTSHWCLRIPILLWDCSWVLGENLFLASASCWTMRRWCGSWELPGSFWFCHSFGKIGRQIVGTASAFVNCCLSRAWCSTDVTRVELLGCVGIFGSCFLRHKSRAPSLTLSPVLHSALIGPKFSLNAEHHLLVFYIHWE